MGRVEIEPITSEYRIPPIDCGVQGIQNMMSEAYLMTILKQGMAYNVFLDGTVVAQFLIRMYMICDERYECSIGSHEFACIKIEYLAVDKPKQHRGFGTIVIKSIIKMCRDHINILPIRFILIESVQDKEEWYRKFAFERLPDGVILTRTNNEGYTIPMCIDFMNNEEVEAYAEA